jgi:hypothetical protein
MYTSSMIRKKEAIVTNLRKILVFLRYYDGKLARWGVESSWVLSAWRSLIGLVYLPRLIMVIENFVE